MRDFALRMAPLVTALPAPTSAIAGAVVRLTADNKPYWCDGTAWLALTAPISDARLTTVRLTADVTNATTTLANVTGLTVALNASSTYVIDAWVMFQTAATTTGIRLTQSVPSGATVVANWATPLTATTATLAHQRAGDVGAASASIDTANVNTLATGRLLVITGVTAGSLQIRFASEVAASNAVVKAGSSLTAIKTN
ncbi:MAG: hypothetical protein IPL03_10515 [Sterolibacteriaceae bacterium]|nr:hypothetical protein [Candidatus Methylophosphatis haderslevensis]